MAQDLEIIEERPIVDASVVETVTRAEIDKLIETARRWPRSVTAAIEGMQSLACLDEESAAECIYSLPRDGKTVVGPSIRFAEMSAQMWGNARIAARITMIDRAEKFVEAEGFFLDAQTNVAQVARIRRRISGKGGRLYSDDMIMVTGNAASSIAKRNAILAGIPKMAWRPAYAGALKILRGTADTLAARRGKALDAFGQYGLKPTQVFQIMSVKGLDDIDVDRLVHLRGLYSALTNGEVTVEELLRAAEPEKVERVTAVTAKTEAPAIFDTADLPSVDAAPAAPAAKKPDKKPDKPDEKPTAASALVNHMRVRRAPR